MKNIFLERAFGGGDSNFSKNFEGCFTIFSKLQQAREGGITASPYGNVLSGLMFLASIMQLRLVLSIVFSMFTKEPTATSLASMNLLSLDTRICSAFMVAYLDASTLLVLYLYQLSFL